jgi:hypothetical protein
MSDVLKMIKDLEDRLWENYGNPLERYKKTQHDIHMTYYVGKLMKERGHEPILPSRISGEHEDRAYYSESALHEAFLAGQLLAKASNLEMRKAIISELKAELRHAVDTMNFY